MSTSQCAVYQVKDTHCDRFPLLRNHGFFTLLVSGKSTTQSRINSSRL